jgi:hypothetical protein
MRVVTQPRGGELQLELRDEDGARSFWHRYPDLQAWLAAPLAERVGVSVDRSVTNCPALARPYRAIWPNAAASASTGIGSSAWASTRCLASSSRPPSTS